MNPLTSIALVGLTGARDDAPSRTEMEDAEIADAFSAIFDLPLQPVSAPAAAPAAVPFALPVPGQAHPPSPVADQADAPAAMPQSRQPALRESESRAAHGVAVTAGPVGRESVPPLQPAGAGLWPATDAATVAMSVPFPAGDVRAPEAGIPIPDPNGQNGQTVAAPLAVSVPRSAETGRHEAPGAALSPRQPDSVPSDQPAGANPRLPIVAGLDAGPDAQRIASQAIAIPAPSGAHALPNRPGTTFIGLRGEQALHPARAATEATVRPWRGGSEAAAAPEAFGAAATEDTPEIAAETQTMGAPARDVTSVVKSALDEVPSDPPEHHRQGLDMVPVKPGSTLRPLATGEGEYVSTARDPATPGESGVTRTPQTIPAAGADVATPDPEARATTMALAAPDTLRAMPSPHSRETEPAPLSEAAHVARQLAAAIKTHPGGVEVAMHPAELGQMKIAIDRQAQEIVVTLTADRPETLDLMRRHTDVLAQEFRDLGMNNCSFRFAQDGGRNQGHRQQPDILADHTDREPAVPPHAAPQPLATPGGRVATGDSLDLRL